MSKTSKHRQGQTDPGKLYRRPGTASPPKQNSTELRRREAQRWARRNGAVRTVAVKAPSGADLIRRPLRDGVNLEDLAQDDA